MLKVANSVINASRITGVLPVVNGGTGVTTSTGTGNTVLSASPTLSGDVNLSTGNLVIGTAGKGIDFSITASGSGTMTSELFADYEEGTWTPTYEMAFGTNFTSVTYGTAAGRYTKIGRMVYVQCRINTTLIVKGAASGVVVIGGLPYTAASGVNSAGSISSSFDWGTSTPITALVSGVVAYLIKQTTVGGNQDNLAVADISAAGQNDVFFSACYSV